MPHLIELYKQHRDAGLQVFLISNEPVELLQKYAAAAEIPFPVLSDPKREVHQSYGVSAIPVTILVDRDGKVASGLIGFGPSKFNEEFVPAVEAVLKS